MARTGRTPCSGCVGPEPGNTLSIIYQAAADKVTNCSGMPLTCINIVQDENVRSTGLIISDLLRIQARRD
jgi:hypothetical protein